MLFQAHHLPLATRLLLGDMRVGDQRWIFYLQPKSKDAPEPVAVKEILVKRPSKQETVHRGALRPVCSPSFCLLAVSEIWAHSPLLRSFQTGLVISQLAPNQHLQTCWATTKSLKKASTGHRGPQSSDRDGLTRSSLPGQSTAAPTSFSPIAWRMGETTRFRFLLEKLMRHKRGSRLLTQSTRTKPLVRGPCLKHRLGCLKLRCLGFWCFYFVFPLGTRGSFLRTFRRALRSGRPPHWHSNTGVPSPRTWAVVCCVLI